LELFRAMSSSSGPRARKTSARRIATNRTDFSEPALGLCTSRPISDPAHSAPGFCCAFAASGKSCQHLMPPLAAPELMKIWGLYFPSAGRCWDFLRRGRQARTVSPVDVTAVRGSQLTYCVEVAAELLADVEEQTVRSVHQSQRPGRESPVGVPIFR